MDDVCFPAVKSCEKRLFQNSLAEVTTFLHILFDQENPLIERFQFIKKNALIINTFGNFLWTGT